MEVEGAVGGWDAGAGGVRSAGGREVMCVVAVWTWGSHC